MIGMWRKMCRMDRIKRIPVVGYILRIIISIVKLPKHIDAMYGMLHENERLSQEQKAIDQVQDILRKENDELGRGVEELRSWNMDRMSEIQSVQNRIDILENLQLTREYVEKLNRLLSIVPTIWGKKEHLHISQYAALSGCMLNTNSGSITIGDYTFCGSGVSILAGSHDKNLTGLLRRDVEYKDGCDIVIGNGVWLASNCTILGPATIGDNAVIAAGAVVVPGTVVPPNAVYGGVPAKRIQIMPESELNTDVAIRKALERNEGVLFVDGWSEKLQIEINGERVLGHYLICKEAMVYFKNSNLCFFAYLLDDDQCELEVDYNDIHDVIHLNRGVNKISIAERATIDNNIIKMHIKTDKKQLFVAERMKEK